MQLNCLDDSCPLGQGSSETCVSLFLCVSLPFYTRTHTRAHNLYLPCLPLTLVDADANLRGVTLSGANLVGSSMRKAFLSGCDLRGCDMSGCDLTGAVLCVNSELGRCIAARGWMYLTSLLVARSLHVHDITAPTLPLPHFLLNSDANLSNAVLINASLAGATLQRADLSTCDLREHDLSGCDFKGVLLAEGSGQMESGAGGGGHRGMKAAC